MPRVGSSKMKMRPAPASHLPSTTFCWLPPLSSRTGCVGVALTRSSSLIGAASVAPRIAARARRAAPAGGRAAARCCARRQAQHQPLRLAILGQQADAAGDRVGGMRGTRVSAPSTSSRPRSSDRRRRRRARARCVRRRAGRRCRAPRRARSEKLMSREHAVDGQRLDPQQLGARLRRAPAGKCSLRSRFAISRTSSVDGHLIDRRASSRAAVAQHGDRAADAEHLVEPVRDVDDRDAARR